MIKFPFLFFLCCFHFVVLAQTPQKPAEIEFDAKTHRTDKDFPFDAPTIIKVTNPPSLKISSIHVYQIRYHQGKRELKPNDNGGRAKPDFKVLPDTSKGVLTFELLGIKPNKEFDVALYYDLREDQLKLAEQLGHLMFNNWNFDLSSDTVKNTYNRLAKTLAEFDRVRFSHNMTGQYFDQILNPIFTDEIEILQPKKLTSCPLIDLAALQLLSVGVCDDCITDVDLQPLQNLFFSDKMPEVLAGKIAIGEVSQGKILEDYMLMDRLKNITQAAAYFSKLFQLTNQLAAYDYKKYRSLQQATEVLSACFDRNKIYLENLVKAFKRILLARGVENKFWLVGSSGSKDLTTTSTRIFSVDAGLTNLWLRDVDNSVAAIPKLYLGLNIYFRPVNKNIRDWLYPRLIAKNSSEPQELVARRTPFQRLALSVGLTLGTTKRQNFSDLYNSMSLLVGPSYRMGRAFRASVGGCVMRRMPVNPTVKQTNVVTGFYSSISLDMDLFQSIKTISSKLF